MASTKTRSTTRSKKAKARKAKAKSKVKRRSTKKDDPQQTLILAGDDGKFYRVTQSQWQTEANLLTGAGTTGVVRRLKDLGTLVASLPLDFAAGEGLECILVNVDAIVKE
jgi:hypothetical protein